jgi:DNA mismatch repair protein MutS
MPFEIDQQTLSDLFLTGVNDDGIFHLFKPVTVGGMVKLKEIFDTPLTDIEILTSRLAAIKFFAESRFHIMLHKEETDFIAFYLEQGGRLPTPSKIRAINNQFINWLRPSNQQYVIARGVGLLLNLLYKVAVAFEGHQKTLPEFLKNFSVQTDKLLECIPAHLTANVSLTAIDLESVDHIFRHAKKKEVKEFLSTLYIVDVYSSVAVTARLLNFSYPEFVNTTYPELKLKGFFHPFVKQPVTNDIEFTANHNMCFITGANMAGKSTLLKSIGICIYLAHIGFPVPAAVMQTSVFNGLFTTINLADNVKTGHSHFYSEVMRIKEVAVQVGTKKNILVIFDELFRGTNVKDAYDASLAIIKAFADVRDSVFLISTHIVEVADELKTTENIFFNCLKTVMVQDKAVYDYTLKQGISNERLGMRIIEEAGLVATIKSQFN